MITIWKLTISGLRLGIPNFLKTSFTMAVDWNAVLNLHKGEISSVEIAKRLDMNRLTEWKIVKKFQDPWPTRARKKTESASLNFPKTRGKSCDQIPSAFCALWSQTELPALHRRHFGGLPAALGQEALPMSSLVPATGLCAFSRFQDYPVLDLEENPLIHKQENLACKEPCS